MRHIAEKLLQLVASFHRIKVVAVNIRALVSALVDVVKACVHKASLNGLYTGSSKRLTEYEVLAAGPNAKEVSGRCSCFLARIHTPLIIWQI